MNSRLDRVNNESGITIAEVLVSLALFAALSITLLSMLRSSANHAAVQDQRITTETEAWRAVDQIVDDVRVARFAPELSAAKDLRQSLALSLTNADGKPVLVQWQVDKYGLQRLVSEPVLGAKPSPTLTTSLVIPDEEEATFVYLATDGQVIDPRTDPEKLRLCTAQIKILIHSPRPDGGLNLRQASATFRLNPELLSC